MMGCASYLVTHSEASVVGGGSPQISHEADIEEVHNVEPAIQHKPPCLPVLGHEAGVTAAGKDKGVDEKEAKDHNDAAQNAPPELLVHHCLCLLLAVDEVLHRGIEGVQCPNVKGRQSSREGKNDEQHQRTSAVRSDRQTGDRVDDSKDKVSNGQNADVNHRLPQ